MSNFMKKGIRANKIINDKRVKQHVKAVYAIMDKFEEIVPKLDLSIDYNEENINEYVNPVLGRDLDNLEKFLFLGKIHYTKQEQLNGETTEG